MCCRKLPDVRWTTPHEQLRSQINCRQSNDKLIEQNLLYSLQNTLVYSSLYTGNFAYASKPFWIDRLISSWLDFVFSQ